MVDKKYQIIYADPPWEYDSARSLAGGSLLTGQKQEHYPYMSIEDICNLNVQKFTDDDSLLFMWATSPKLNLAFDVGKAWGFQYVTIAFVWDKVDINPGSYTLSSVELCLVFRKGGIPKPRGLRNVRQFLQEKKTSHSRKPHEIRKRINDMFPTQNKIELFARGRDSNLFGWDEYNGWDKFGNEVESDINLTC